MRQAGILDKLEKKWLTGPAVKPSSNDEDSGDNGGLGYDNVLFAFAIVPCGIAFGTVAGAYEFLKSTRFGRLSPK